MSSEYGSNTYRKQIRNTMHNLSFMYVLLAFEAFECEI